MDTEGLVGLLEAALPQKGAWACSSTYSCDNGNRTLWWFLLNPAWKSVFHREIWKIRREREKKGLRFDLGSSFVDYINDYIDKSNGVCVSCHKFKDYIFGYIEYRSPVNQAKACFDLKLSPTSVVGVPRHLYNASRGAVQDAKYLVPEEEQEALEANYLSCIYDALGRSLGEHGNIDGFTIITEMVPVLNAISTESFIPDSNIDTV